MQEASCTVPGDIRATFVRLLAYMGALAILAIAAASLFRTPSSIAAIQPAPQPEWINVGRPHPAFDMQMPELAAGGFNYAILRRNADNARKDVLSWGDAPGGGPYVLVEIYRPGTANERFMDAPSEIAARIVGFTITDDVKPAGEIDSKFGAVSLVNFAIAVPGTHNGRQRRCLGFARSVDDPPLQIAGWYCSAGDEVVDRATLACMLDRLTILSAGGDSGVDDL
ncbi:MAG: hypothetical protein WA893_23835, partial [Xanthobacteraceae bacterium]